MNFFEKFLSASDDANHSFHTSEVAACALLIEIAEADENFSEEEKLEILNSISSRVGKETAEEIYEEAKAVRQDAVDFWHFGHELNERFSYEQKLDVLLTAWKIALSDGIITSDEDAVLHKISNILRLKHKDFIDAKLQAKSEQD